MIEKTNNNKRYYELTENECGGLFTLEDKVRGNAYPKEKNQYAAAVLTESGNMYGGISYRSKTETLTMHAEMTALSNAAINGETNIIAITGPNCHMCKQLIYENSLNSGIDIVVVTKKEEGITQTPISQLMPQSWPE